MLQWNLKELETYDRGEPQLVTGEPVEFEK